MTTGRSRGDGGTGEVTESARTFQPSVPVVTATRARGRDRVEIELDGSPWRIVSLAAAARAGIVNGTVVDRGRARELNRALRLRDTTLLGVVLNVLLAWPDVCFRAEVVKHPRTKHLLASVQPIFKEHELAPKESELLRICREEKAAGERPRTKSTHHRMILVARHYGVS